MFCKFYRGGLTSCFAGLYLSGLTLCFAKFYRSGLTSCFAELYFSGLTLCFAKHLSQQLDLMFCWTLRFIQKQQATVGFALLGLDVGTSAFCSLSAAAPADVFQFFICS